MSSCCASCPLYARTAHCHAARSHDTCHAAGPDLTPAATRRAAPPPRWGGLALARPGCAPRRVACQARCRTSSRPTPCCLPCSAMTKGKENGTRRPHMYRTTRTDPTIHPSTHTQAHTRAHTYAHAPRARCMFTTVSMRMTATPANDDYWRVLRSREGLQQLITTVSRV
jgi:hypothetical protein